MYPIHEVMSRFPSFLHRVFESPREEIARGPGWCQHLRTAVRQLQAHNPGRKCIETIAFWLQIIKRYAARDLIIPLRERNTALLELPMKKETSMYMYICRLKSQLRQVFPQYLTIFSKVNGKASLEVLSQYPSPEAILSAGADLRISKRGSPYARRCFYMLALQSVSLRKNGEPKTPVLRAYYLEKCKSKPKMTALGAIMYKLCSIVFAVLRDEKPFVLISPQEHCQKYLSASQAT